MDNQYIFVHNLEFTLFCYHFRCNYKSVLLCLHDKYLDELYQYCTAEKVRYTLESKHYETNLFMLELSVHVF
jgi:hypothetical protein